MSANQTNEATHAMAAGCIFETLESASVSSILEASELGPGAHADDNLFEFGPHRRWAWRRRARAGPGKLNFTLDRSVIKTHFVSP